MKSRVYGLALSAVLSFFSSSVYAQSATSACVAPPAPVIAGMHQTLNETFDKGYLNLNYWNAWPQNAVNADGSMFAEGGLTTAYVPGAFAFLPGGGLRIVAQKRPLGNMPWTSGKLTNFGSFAQTYGHFEMTAKVPKGNGLWPAFWLLPDNYTWPPEIDILEVLGQDPTAPFFSLHTGPTNTNNATVRKTVDLSAACHTYAIDWQPNSLTWSLDGTQVFSVTGASVPSQPMYMIINLAVGGQGTWAKYPDASTPYANFMDIYAVRAYKDDNVAQPAPEPAVFGKTTLSSYWTKPGTTIHLASSLKIGATALGPTYFQVLITGYGKTYVVPTPIFAAGTGSANSVLPLNADIQLPSSIPSGVYNVRIQILAYAAGKYPSVPTAAMFNVLSSGS